MEEGSEVEREGWKDGWKKQFPIAGSPAGATALNCEAQTAKLLSETVVSAKPTTTPLVRTRGCEIQCHGQKEFFCHGHSRV